MGTQTRTLSLILYVLVIACYPTIIATGCSRRIGRARASHAGDWELGSQLSQTNQSNDFKRFIHVASYPGAG